MKTTYFLLCIGFMLVFAKGVFANGGTFATSSVIATGNLVPEKKQKIHLEDELLNIKLDGEWASVEVLYTLINRGGKTTATYAFPVDTNSGTLNSVESIKYFRIMDGGKNLGITEIINRPGHDDYTEQPYGPTMRNWFTTDLDFQNGERKYLTVSYEVKSLGTVSGTSKSMLWAESPRVFTYSLKPAKTWGNGKVKHLEIKLDIRELKKSGIPINSIKPEGSFEKDGILHWKFENLELSKAPEIIVNYDNERRAAHGEATSNRLNSEFVASIRTSSTLPPSKKASYEAKNLLDGNLHTAWIEGVKGTGAQQWIEVTFKKPILLKGIGILNGYLKSEESLRENGQVSEMQVHVYAAKEGDLKEKAELKKTVISDVRELPGAEAQWVFDYGDGSFLAKRFRLSILKAASGSRFSDTAISEIYIYGRAPKSESD